MEEKYKQMVYSLSESLQLTCFNFLVKNLEQENIKPGDKFKMVMDLLISAFLSGLGNSMETFSTALLGDGSVTAVRSFIDELCRFCQEKKVV